MVARHRLKAMPFSQTARSCKSFLPVSSCIGIVGGSERSTSSTSLLFFFRSISMRVTMPGLRESTQGQNLRFFLGNVIGT